MTPLLNPAEIALLEISLKYKKEYESTPWWKFNKRSELKAKWHSARADMMRCCHK